MGDRLKGKVAIVTGSGRGIGRGEALALASEGARVVVNDLGVARDGSGVSASPADEVVAEIKKMGSDAVANYDSVSTWASAEKIVKTAIDTFGRLDILVNNAGILRDRMVFNMAEEDWDIIMKVHLYGHFFMIRHAVPIFRQQKSGRIINTSSVAGLGTTFGQANYGAAKEGIVGLTRQVARDMVRYGVTCNAIRPNAGTRMTLNDELIAAWKKAGMEMAAEALKAAKPEDIAPLIVWLASDASAHVTGRTFYVQTGTIALFTEPEQTKTVNKDGSWTIDEVFKLMPEVTAGLSA
jgi:NAD(P)-dependent dehydrogenase (short-subunit alcohol dehydrogenase family)